MSYEFDQSLYVTRTIRGLTLEGGLGAVLTGLMIFLFLRDWHSALIVVINIPLPLMAALLALWISKQTVNIMTLGGLALAVGILVDEATVYIENIHTHMTPGSSLNGLRATPQLKLPRRACWQCSASWQCSFPTLFMVGAAKRCSCRCRWRWLLHDCIIPLSTTLVPVLSAWIMRRRAMRRNENRLFGTAFMRLIRRYLNGTLRFRWPLSIAYVVLSIAISSGWLCRAWALRSSLSESATAATPIARTDRHADRTD